MDQKFSDSSSNAANEEFWDLANSSSDEELMNLQITALQEKGRRRRRAIMLSIIYIEVCRRLSLTIVGSRVGEEFLIWLQTGYPEELFKVTSGHSLFAIVNGRCVEDPRSKASDLTSNSLSGLEIATNRDIIGIALANLVRLHWKLASRSTYGLMLTSPLRHVHNAHDKLYKITDSKAPLLRPQELR